jgi:hypothetical protein
MVVLIMDKIICYWCDEKFNLEGNHDGGFHFLGDVGLVPICPNCYADLYGVLL